MQDRILKGLIPIMPVDRDQEFSIKDRGRIMKTLDTKNFSVPGYKAWGISCGIKKTDKKDLAIIFSDREASVAGVFTKNRVKAAPVLLDMAKVKSGKGQVIVANSGCANACTGKRGLADARETAEAAANEFGVKPDAVLVASTGVIGEYLPVTKVGTGIATAAGLLSPTGWEQAAEAIMTTDIYPKLSIVQEEIGGKTVTVAGIAKGSGMIHPNMATMLCFIVTDAALAAALAQEGAACVHRKVLQLDYGGRRHEHERHGPLHGKRRCGQQADRRREQGLQEVSGLPGCSDPLACQAGRARRRGCDEVRGDRSAEREEPLEAKRAAMTVAKSSLVKTALFGEDANWGRIMAALGYSGVDMDEARTDISIGKTKIVEKGLGMGKAAERDASLALKQREVQISHRPAQGERKRTVWTCDMSYEYVKINAAYRS